MNRKFIKIASAATALALAFTVGVSSVGAEDVPEPENPYVDLTGDNAQMIIMNKEYVDAYNQALEEAMDDEMSKLDEAKFSEELAAAAMSKGGELPPDPRVTARKRAEERAEAECEKMGLRNTLELTPMQNTYYKGWTGTFEVDSIEKSTLYFSTPTTFSCSAGSRTSRIESKTDWVGNYKTASVTVTYADGTTSTATNHTNNSTLSVSASYKSGTIVSARYEFMLLNGTGSGAPILELAIVNLVRK